MKKTLSILCIPFTVYAQKNVFLKGKLPELAGQTVLLENSKQLKEPLKFDQKGNFALNASLDSGYYTIDRDVLLYLGPGMNLTLGGDLANLKIQGQGELENRAQAEINRLIQQTFPVVNGHLHKHFNSLPPEDFIQLSLQFKQQAFSILHQQNYGSKFITSQQDHIEYTIRYFINDYLKRYGINPEKEDAYYKLAGSLRPGSDVSDILLPAAKAIYVRHLSSEQTAELQAKVWEGFDINRVELYSFSPYYRSLISGRLESLRAAELIKSPYLKNRSSYELKSDIVQREFAEGFIKEELLFQNTNPLITGSADDEKFLKQYLSVAKDSFYRKQVQLRFDKLRLVSPGAEAPQFSYKDQSNRTVSLSNFRGSYVYLDIWATWCGPCKTELSYLKEIERRYQNQNLRFISISVDLQAHRERWMQHVKEQNLTGTQVLADHDFGSDFIQAFGINTIPRFILIDPEGKIVSGNAPRPSNPKLQQLLDKLLSNSLSSCTTCSSK
ncbi:TlpA family protein disulfide reductase [Desertivirga arenae]|uniref:TlpA family protein disulfide reductase n=1 Tax=Desertivirga arenae TaxID=2810309 RepID=UPI001A97137D|nr:TlpA disulfide reductase family protein [Pedobacter sp. SYSU D00823]